MREIEFRAWLKKQNQMRNKVSFHAGQLWTGYTWITLDDNVELMQYTGLKDKNGVKIFEGDVVKTYSGVIYVVYFDERSGVFGLISSSLYGYEDRRWFDDISNMVVINNSEVYKNLEVIGNIYENPELLEVDDE